MKQPQFRIGDTVERAIEAYLTSREVKAYPVAEFFNLRVKIRNLYSSIVSLVPNNVQLKHQALKERYRKEGRKPHFLLLKSRRAGLTTWEQALSYRATVTSPHVTCATVADTRENTKMIFRMVLLMLHLDTRLQYSPRESQSHIEIPSLGTYFHVGTAGSKAFSRGDNLYRFHGSEVAWWQGAYDDIENLAAGFTEAARHGEVVLETTANGAQGWFYENFKEAMAGENNWIPLFYPWYIDGNNIIEPTSETSSEFLETITDEEKHIMERFELSIGQMLWRRDKKKERKKLFQQEYPETWEQAFVVRGLQFFDSEMLDDISSKTLPVKHLRESLTVWEEPGEDEEYVAGADAAEGNPTSDNSVCAILNKKTGNQAAVLRGKWRPEVFARKCIELCRKYNDAIFAPELNNHGHSVMNTALNSIGYRQIYYHIRTLDKNKFGKPVKEKRPGWLTTAQTRPILLDELNEAMEERFIQVNDTVFIAECKTFVDTGGKYEADKGQHDDSIFAWGIAWQARKQPKRTFNIV